MKKSSKILVGILIVLSLAIGFVIGILVDFPKTEKEALAGTIGRISNYRNVKISESDIKLRSELKSSDHMLKQYQLYFSYQYSSSSKLSEGIKFALDASKVDIDFSNQYPDEIAALSNYYSIISQARKDILAALATLQNLDEMNECNLGNLINNANVAIAQIKFNENKVTDFIEAVENYISANKTAQYADLKKAHDMLTMNQFAAAIITNDKPMQKYFNNKVIYSDTETLNQMQSQTIDGFFIEDFEVLKGWLIVSDAMIFESVADDINNSISAIYSTAFNAVIVGIQENSLGVANAEQLNMIYETDGGTGVGDAIDNIQQFQDAVYNTQQLGLTLPEPPISSTP